MKKETLFIFCGPTAHKTALAFAQSNKISFELGVERLAKVVILRDAVDDDKVSSPISCARFLPGVVQTYFCKNKVFIDAAEGDSVEIIMAGEAGAFGFDFRKKNFILNFVGSKERVDDACAVDDNDNNFGSPTTSGLIASEKSQFELTHTLLIPLSVNTTPKPTKGVNVNLPLPFPPGHFEWISRSFVDSSLLSNVSHTVDNGILKTSISEYEGYLELFNFFSNANRMQPSAEIILDTLNNLICSNLIVKNALALMDLDIPFEISVSINDNSLCHPAVFSPLIYKKNVKIATAPSSKVDSGFRVSFLQPFSDTRSVYKALISDMEAIGSVNIFHAANREIIEHEIFQGSSAFIYYEIDDLLEKATFLLDENNIQEQLEKKALFYAAQRRSQMQRLRSFLV